MSEKSFKYTTALDKIRRMDKRIKIIQGGTSAGKTFCILGILIDKALKSDNLKISVVSKSFPHLRGGAIRDFLDIMRMTNRYKEKNWNISTSTYQFANGSYIEFFSAHDTERVTGPRRDILYVNEAYFIPFQTYDQMAIRTSGDVYIDYNPIGRFWVHDTVASAPNSEFIIVTYRDNEGLSQNIIDDLEYKRHLSLTSDHYKNWCQVYLDGEIGNLEGAVITNWREINEVPKNSKLVGYGMDFGFTTDPTAIVAVYKMDGELYVDELLYRKGLYNSDISNFIKSEKMVGEIFADSAEPKTIAELKRYGHRVIPATKGKDSIKFGLSILGEQTIYVTSRSVNLIKELQSYVWKKDSQGNSLNVPEGPDHAIDALRYLAMMRLGNRDNNKKTFRIG